MAAFVTASRVLVSVAARSLADADDVTIPQFRALVILTTRGAMHQAELADLLGVHQSTLTRLCDRLVRKDLATRTTDEHDRRRVVVEPTAAGRNLVRQVTRRRARDISRIVDAMTPTQRQAAVIALNAFADAAGEPPADPFGWAPA